MPCEDGEHEKLVEIDGSYAELALWRSRDNARTIKIFLCSKCKTMFWDGIVDTEIPEPDKPDPKNPRKSWQFEKPLRGKKWKAAVKKWNKDHPELEDIVE